MNEAEEVETTMKREEEEPNDEHLIEMKQEEKYLGGIIMNNGNTRKIQFRRKNILSDT